MHCSFYNTTLGRMFGNLKLYAKAFPQSWKAEEFRAGKYDLLSVTRATLHPDY